MDINTTRFGQLEIDPETVIEFPQGLVGLEQNKNFKLLHEGDEPTVHYLQSLDDADIALSVTAPANVGVAYEFVIDDDEAALLGLEPGADVVVLMVLYRDEDKGDALNQAEGRNVRGNLRAPIIINVNKRVGLQKVLSNIRHTTLIQAEA